MTDIRIGGSSAARVINCPGSVLLSQGAPDQESAEAKDGTRAHNLGELCLREGIDPEDMVGRFIDQVEVDEDLAASVSFHTDLVRSWFTDASGQEDVARKAGLQIEAEIDLSAVDPVCSGKCDVYSHQPNERVLDVADYKHGAGVAVEVLDNDQLLYYALGAMLAVGGDVETINLHVVQPNCPHIDGPVRTVTVTPITLFEFGLRLKAAIELSRQPGAPLKSGSWCQFCKASGYCPELFRATKKALEYEAQDALTADMGGTLEPDEVAKRLALIEPVRHWVTGIKRFAFNEAQRGRPATGWKLVRVKPRRKWKGDPKAVEAVMRQASRVFKRDEDSFFKRRPITPRALEKLVGEKAAAEFVLAHIDEPNRAVSLVPVTDRRIAVEPSVDLEFADLMETDNATQE